MLNSDPLFTQEETDSITIPDVNGNPDFDLETPRQVRVYPYAASDGRIHPFRNPNASVPHMDRFMDIKGKEVRMFMPETDENHVAVLDKYGNVKYRMVQDEKNPSVTVPQKFVLQIPQNGYVEFSLPQDRALFELYLLKCPRNASVDFIDGHPNNIFPYKFYIDDPITKRKRRNHRREMEKQAVEFARNIKEHQLETYALYFGIDASVDEGDDYSQWESEIRYQLEKMARESGEEFLYKTKLNQNLERELFMCQAQAKRVIVNRGAGGYFFQPNDPKAKRVAIGHTPEIVWKFLEQNPSIYKQAIEASGFSLYLGTSEEMVHAQRETGMTPFEAAKSTQEALMKELEEIRALKEELKAQLGAKEVAKTKNADPAEEFAPKPRAKKVQEN